MSAIKNNISNISDDTQVIIKDYLKLLMLKQTEKFALALGIIASVFIVSTLLLIVVVFCSFALATYLNSLLVSEYLGFAFVTVCYLIVITLIMLRLVRSKKPLLTNLFVKLIVLIFDVELRQTKNIKGLKLETDDVNHKLKADKVKFNADIQILRYGFLESIFKDFIGLFTPQKKNTTKEDIKSDEAYNEKKNMD